MFRGIWRLFRTKRPFKLTGPGWVFILYTIGVGAGAINTGNNLLYLVFGVFLGLLLASGFLSDLSLWGVAIEAAFPHAGMIGQPVSVFLNVTNRKRWFPALAVTVTLEGDIGGQSAELKLYVPFVSAGETTTARFEWTPPRRGWFQMRNIRMSTRYPFGLLEKWWRLRSEVPATSELRVGDSEHGMFVVPPAAPVDVRRLAAELRGEEQPVELDRRGESTHILGLRAYAPGDSPRRIHWRASAKRAPLVEGESLWLVREMTLEQKQQIVIRCPDRAAIAGFDADQGERLVGFLASVIQVCRLDGNDPRVMLEGNAAIDHDAFLALWKPQSGADPALRPFLAPVEASGRPDKFVDLLELFNVGNAG